MERMDLVKPENAAMQPAASVNIRVIPLKAALALFFLLNALKITLFNTSLLEKQSNSIIIYKFILTLLVLVIIYPLLYMIGSRLVMILCYTIQASYITVNLGYYLYFRSYLHILQYFPLLREAFSIAGNSAVPLNAKMLMVLIDLPFFIYILVSCKRERTYKKRPGKAVVTVMLASLLILSSVEVYNVIHKNSIFNIVRDTFSGESPIVERYGTLADNIVDLIRNGSNNALISQLRYGREQSSASQPAVAAAKTSDTTDPDRTAASAKASAGDASRAAAAESHPNYILIQVESMDASIVNQTYNGAYITPFLHSLESECIYYPYVMSYHEGGGTSDSEFSVLNSVEPLSGYPALKLSGYDYPNSLVKRLKEESYTTLAFHGNVGSFYNRDVAFPKIGYNSFYDMRKMELPENGWGVPDDAVFNYALNQLGTVDGPFFAHIITMTSHEPFNSARHYYNNRLYDSIGDSTVKEYYNSMSYVDKSLQDFINKVRARYKNTYIILYGDHTPNISSSIYKQASLSFDGKYLEFVPMMIITPDGKMRRESEKAASFLDVAPTVLKTSGIEYNFKSDGQNLAGSILEAGSLPFRGRSYDRALLFKNASATALPN